MEEVRSAIKSILPTITDETLESVLQRIDDLGVDEIAHLELVTEEDLIPVLKKIQARLLIREWRKNNKNINNESQNELNNTSVPTPVPSTTSTKEDEAFKNPCAFNAKKFFIPWESMPVELIRSLKENERPTPSLRNNMVRVIAENIYKIEKKPGRKALAVIAEKIVEKYPQSFSDEICKEISSASHLSLLKQLEVRFDNLNRSNIINVLKRSSNNESNGSCKKIRSSDCYGCVNYQPNLPLEETVQSQLEKQEKMKIFYASGIKATLNQECRSLLSATNFSIRKDINSGKDLNYLITQWPLLFVKEGFLDHFNGLVGIHIEKKLGLAISKMGVTIISFFLSEPKVKSIGKDELKSMILQLKSNAKDEQQMYTWEVLISLLMIYFGENIEVLFVTVDVASTVNEVEMIIPNTPCLICYGDQLQNATSYMLAVDSKIIIQNIKDFNDGLALLFSSFYCLNIEYPLSAATTLEFIQRCFLDINPSKGSKVNSKRRKEIVNPKIISLKKRITDFEWNL